MFTFCKNAKTWRTVKLIIGPSLEPLITVCFDKVILVHMYMNQGKQKRTTLYINRFDLVKMNIISIAGMYVILHFYHVDVLNENTNGCLLVFKKS